MILMADEPDGRLMAARWLLDLLTGHEEIGLLTAGSPDYSALTLAGGFSNLRGCALDNIPRFCSLDGFTELSSSNDGIALRALTQFDMVRARTQNHEYYIFLIEPETGKAYVQGGRFFAQPIEATVSGSTFGGCMLKMGWLGVGLRIEICAGGQRIVTSPVKSLHVERNEN